MRASETVIPQRSFSTEQEELQSGSWRMAKFEQDRKEEGALQAAVAHFQREITDKDCIRYELSAGTERLLLSP